MKQATMIVALGALACAGVAQPADAKDKVFALVPKNMNNPFFDQARDGCQKAAAEIGGIEGYYIRPRGDGGGDEQFPKGEELIAKKGDGPAGSGPHAPADAQAPPAAQAPRPPPGTRGRDPPPPG